MNTNGYLYSNLYKKGRVLLMTSALVTTFFSCSKKEDLQSTEQAQTTVDANAATATNANLLYEETFEGTFFPEAGTGINVVHGIENCNNNGVASPSTYDWTLLKGTKALAGNYAAKFEVRKDQPLVGSAQRVRSEVTIFKPQEDAKFANQPEMWYSFSLYLPSVGMEDDPDSKENVMQWFEDGGDDCTIKIKNGRAYFSHINTFYDVFGAANSGSTTSTTTVGTSFKHIPLDSWHEFVFHFIHSTGSDGLVEIWRDGAKIQTLKGPNMHSTTLPKWKVGLYKSDYTAHPEYSIRPSRIVYFDNIRVGKKGSTFSDLTSSGTGTGSGETPTTPPANVSPTANAGSDVTITLPTSSVSLKATASDPDGSISTVAWTKVSGADGVTFSSLSTLTPTVSNLKEGTYTFRVTVTDNQGATATDDVVVKVNAAATTSAPITGFTLINAATDKDVVVMQNGGSYSLSSLALKAVNIRANTTSSFGYVTFTVSGAQSLTTKDKVAPYALQGDDGKGNYYYGKWNPPAIGTYTLVATPYSAAGVAGTSTTITFNITK